MMNGIASLLDQPATAKVESLWRELETSCGLVGVKVTPFPHFSWQVTEGYDPERLQAVMRKIARRAQPFTVRTAGLGLFTGEKPIVFVSIVKDERLMRFHSMLWKSTQGIAIQPSPFYAPEQWVPHITLIYHDLQHSNLECAMQGLAFQNFDWEIQIDNLTVIDQVDDQPAETVLYRFGS